MTRDTAHRLSPLRVLAVGVIAALLVAGLATTGATSATAGPGSGARHVVATAPASAPVAASAKHTVTYDSSSFKVDGQRVYLFSGEFHYFRLPSPDLWLDIFQKMKASGFNSTSLYFDWGYHSPTPGVYDFTGVRDIDKLLDLAERAGLYVIARPAPYINAEVAGGGLPGWMATKPGQNRSADPLFTKYADQWLTEVDRIITRHQLTKGGGSVIGYQVENEYYNGSTAGRAYMQHLEDKARADGITVPLLGNHNGVFNSGAAALDVDGVDSYPQGFDCSNPTTWRGVPNIASGYSADKPLTSPEFQGGAFDPWGGPGYDKCAQLINDQFANVFYKQNIAVGVTMQSFYMTYGGTNWGWLGMPQNYTSYDYGAAIRETRQADPKLAEDKLIGYLTQAAAPLTRTSPTRSASANPAIVDTARINPDDGTQFHTLRHADSTATTTDTTHLAIDLAATPVGDETYTFDDIATALTYAGPWTHAKNESYTRGDYQQTESFSNTAGDSVTIPFTGTAVRWIGSKTNNHGTAGVYLDGVLAATVDTAGAQDQAVLYATSGLADGAHTLKIVVTGQNGAGSSDAFVPVDAIDVPTGAQADATYPVVPQQPGTAITLQGRDSDILLANYALGASHLQYSTSELMTNATIGTRDVAILYGERGTDGETVLRYSSRPTVSSTDGSVSTTWDPTTGDLRLNYRHTGLSRVTITGGGTQRPLLLLLADKPTAKTFWRLDTASGPVLVRGSSLLRTATTTGDTTVLTGDNDGDSALEIFTATPKVTWNGRRVQTQATTTGTRAGVIPVARPVSLPALTGWKRADESPEAAATFDDSSWVTADHLTTNSISGAGQLPVLYADDYGFHTGNTWYRGRFRSTGKETGVHLASDSGGTAQAFSVWLNGTFLGSATTGSGDFVFPVGTVVPAGGNVLAVLTVNMGTEEDYNSTDGNKAARGLTEVSLTGSPLTTTTWRLQGVRGGETLQDPVRGAYANGGLYGERAGWSLPGFPDRAWTPVTLPTAQPRAGVSWYRTEATLTLPEGQDTSVGVTMTDDPSRHYRATLFVNGWPVGNYVNDVGPQHSFPVPNGILNPRGKNTIAIAVWNLDGTSGGLGTVALTSYGTHTSPLQVDMNDSPRYDRTRYADPAAPGTTTTLAVPDTVTGGQAFTATATITVPAGQAPATAVIPTLTAPKGWRVGAPQPGRFDTIRPGGTATVTWQVRAPAMLSTPGALIASTQSLQRGALSRSHDERIVGTVPPTPPTGADPVSDLPFVSATNGWGPVERDQSNGEQAPGDGGPLTVDRQSHAKGLGTNSVSVVRIYLGGACTHFTSQVGADDENASASVTFMASADGHATAPTPTMHVGDALRTIDLDVTGAQLLTLTVGDGGDGNGGDHADWIAPVLTCG